MKDIAPSTLKPGKIKDSNISANDFAVFFAKLTNQNFVHNHNSIGPDYNYEGFELAQCTEEEVLKIVNSMPVNKANGIDGIPIKAIKLAIPKLLKPLTSLINSISKGFPSEWL